MRPFRSFGRGDGMDEFLLSEGLWRKTVPKDETSLYRVVSEQVFNTQAFHDIVRKKCDDYIKMHKSSLFEDWNGPIEIKALALVYERDFLIYQHVNRDPLNVTSIGYKKKIVVCLSAGSHYDSVYPRSFMEDAALCQSILYEVLYDRVFEVEGSVAKGQDMINIKPIHNGRNTMSCAADTPSCSSNTFDADSCTADNQFRLTPFPYKVAKSLSPDMFRNVEYDAWLESKRIEQFSRTLQCTSDEEFTPGDKCQVMLDGLEGRVFNGHIQEITPGGETAIVYVEETGRRQLIEIRKLVALPKTVDLDSNWKKRGGKKKVWSCATGVLPDVTGSISSSNKSRMGSNNLFNNSGQRIRINSAGHPIKVTHYDGYHGPSRSSYVNPRQGGNSYQHNKENKNCGQTLKLMNRHRYNSEGHYGDTTDGKFEDMSDQQQHDDCERRHKDPPIVSRSTEPHYEGSDMSSHIKEFDIRQDRSDHIGDHLCGDERNTGSGETNNSRNGLSVTQLSSGHFDGLVSVCQNGQQAFQAMDVLNSSSSSMLHHQMLTPPPLPPQNCVAMPYHNILLPVADNFNSPINVNASPSVEPNGRDLPIHDHSTLRFFFNLGVQYYRMSFVLQPSSHPQQHSMPYITFPMNGATGMCVAPVAAPTGAMISSGPDMFACNEEDFMAGSYGCAPSLSPTNGTFYFSSSSPTPVPPFFQFPGAVPFM